MCFHTFGKVLHHYKVESCEKNEKLMICNVTIKHFGQ